MRICTTWMGWRSSERSWRICSRMTCTRTPRGTECWGRTSWSVLLGPTSASGALGEGKGAVEAGVLAEVGGDDVLVDARTELLTGDVAGERFDELVTDAGQELGLLHHAA